MKKNDILFYIAIFLATFFVMQYFKGGSVEDPILSQGAIGMKTDKIEYSIGKPINLEFQNNTAETIIIPSECPDAPLNIYRFTSSGYEEVKSELEMDCSERKDIQIAAGEKATIDYNHYLYSLFGTVGRYKIEYTMSLTEGEKTFSTPEFEISEPGIFTATWRTLIYQPMLNLLIVILQYTPGHNLGLGIIILTIIIRTVLLVPSQKGMKAQRKMQLLQPKLEEVKKKYAHDQQRLAQETMLLWKKHKVNPLSSCLPILIQLPILIGLYNVIQSGLEPDRAFFIYSFLPEFSLAKIGSGFLGLNLLEKSLIILPVIVGVLQFIQMKMMMAKQKKAKAPDGKSGEIQAKGGDMMDQMAMANNMMLYVMPIMIAVFTASAPAALGIYWGASTLYGIFQQFVVNRERMLDTDTATESGMQEDDVKIRILKKNP